MACTHSARLQCCCLTTHTRIAFLFALHRMLGCQGAAHALLLAPLRASSSRQGVYGRPRMDECVHHVLALHWSIDTESQLSRSKQARTYGGELQLASVTKTVVDRAQ
jgi:hypothetical protein